VTSSDVALRNVSSDWTSAFGVLVEDGRLTLVDSSITNSDQMGVTAWNSDVTLIDSNLTGNGEGLSLHDSGALVSGSTISENRAVGITGLRERVALFDSTVSRNRGVNVWLEDAPAVIKSCVLSGASSLTPTASTASERHFGHRTT